jgi:hypothetical protein
MIIEEYDARVHGEPGRSRTARRQAWDRAFERALKGPIVIRKVGRSAIYAAAATRNLKVEVRQLRDQDGYVVRAYSN